MKSISISDDGVFDLPEEYQECKNVTLRMPYKVIVFQGQSIGTYYRQPAKESPYCENGYLEIGVSGNYQTFMTVDPQGNQIFMETDEIDKYGNPKDPRKDNRVPKNQKTLAEVEE